MTIALNQVTAKQAYDTVRDVKKILNDLNLNGFDKRVSRLNTSMNRFTRGIELEFEERGLVLPKDNQSLVVSKAEHDRVLEQLKRYSGE